VKPKYKRLGMAFALLVVTANQVLFAQAPPQREIAVTIDDLPAAAAKSMAGSEITAMTAKLLGTMRDRKVPVVGFVNERKLYKFGEVDERIKALDMWLDDGFELGNHTFSHASLSRVGLQEWEEDVVRGETVTSLLLAQHKMTKIRYLRLPYLETGRDPQTLREAEDFLLSRGYRIAPVTMDAWDWMFGGLYEDARTRGDTALEQRLVSSYFAHTTEVFEYYEKLSRDLMGYEPKQILLLHMNWLEADHIGELLDLLHKRGYRFITLQEALGDKAYSMPDEFGGDDGAGWAEQWTITRGHPPQNAPVFPQWVSDLYDALPQRPTQP
jgi:peptidoglycan/xylan/chitin deacetylase (PgdA/CDA1 family)